MNSFRKSMLAVMTVSTASFYFAQSEKDTLGRERDIDQIVLTGVADIAKDRKTPVAVSTIKESKIIEKLGNQEFPEILASTPSVYATKSGGGFGDSRINIRGFAQENIAVMINGMPVNDMENSKVYWSNWAGLSDVTSAMQVQRGLGASKLAIASIGGTINIVTRAADKKEGGLVSVGVGNNDYHKALFAYNTGKNEKGWSSSFLLSRTAGSMYVDATNFESYNYYFALGFEPNKSHDFQFTITGAPQTHSQRRNQITIADYITYGHGMPNREYNSDWGYLNGKRYAWSENFYHKPVAMFNWDWKMNSNSKLATVVYASAGRGGGGGSPLGARLSTYRSADGLLDIDKMVADNTANPNSPKILRRASTNNHNWYGILSNFSHKINDNLQFSIGVDGRYYKGIHYEMLTDFLGATSYQDRNDKNLATPRTITTTQAIEIPWNVFKKNNVEKISYANDGEVLWGGLFGQLEYSNGQLSAFFQGSVSEQGFQRIDHFLKPGTLAIANAPSSAMKTKTGFKYLLGYNIKGGLNYNINEHHNVFGNVGYYEKQPFFEAVYPAYRNYLNPNLTNEKIFGTELGYSFRSSAFNANLNLYRTTWKDRYFSKSNRFQEYALVGGVYTQTGNEILGRANIFGVEEVHQGVEVDMEYKLSDLLSVTGMVSFGDWHYKGNVTASYFDESNNPILGANGQAVEDITLYLSDVKVGNAAQLTGSLGLNIKPVKNFSINADWRYVDKLYSEIDPLSFSSQNHQGSLQLPSYNLFDVGVSLKLPVNDKQFFKFTANIYNLLDTTYIAESRTNIHAKQASDFATTQAYETYLQKNIYKGLDTSNQVFFGFGRTWSVSASFNF